jgi:hypothetical protein
MTLGDRALPTLPCQMTPGLARPVFGRAPQSGATGAEYATHPCVLAQTAILGFTVAASTGPEGSRVSAASTTAAFCYLHSVSVEVLFGVQLRVNPLR